MATSSDSSVSKEPKTVEETDMICDSSGIEMSHDNRRAGGGKVGSNSKKKYLHNKESEEYRRRRERNNEAVRKSRQKSRQKASETADRVYELKQENAQLEQRVTLLSKELELLKDLFLTHAQELPDPSTTFGLFNANPNMGSNGPNPALSRIVVKTDCLTVTVSSTEGTEAGIKTET